ncbi:MAG: sigma-70 family RNA polymerase sigma factor [Bacteroidetes bacterium]|nr:sigma-70 family RNA polymerase sigma factor [Bacteroidota bacterium]
MNKEEFQDKIIPLGEKMYRLAFRLLEDKEAARDMLQELYLKLWEKRHELREVSNIEAYACTILKNKCLDKIRLKKTTVDVYQLASLDDNSHEQMDKTEGMMEVGKAIESLPEKQRLIIQMRDIDNYSFEEIAQVLETTENNIRVQLSAARRNVREQLLKVYNYGIPGN